MCDEAELASWLPRGLGTCSVLVLSTRAERVLQRENDAISVQLRPLSKEESRALLVRKVPFPNFSKICDSPENFS
jgi:cytidylate kinase